MSIIKTLVAKYPAPVLRADVLRFRGASLLAEWAEPHRERPAVCLRLDCHAGREQTGGR